MGPVGLQEGVLRRAAGVPQGDLDPNDESARRRFLRERVRSTNSRIEPEAARGGSPGVFPWVARSARHLLLKARRYRMDLRRISFIKPCWSLRDLLLGALYHGKDGREPLIEGLKGTLNSDGLIVLTSSGRTAMELALKVMKRERPDRNRVILPSYGCKGTFDPLAGAELIPLFADVDDNLNISKESVRSVLKGRGDVLCIVVPHIGGCKAEIEEISALARSLDIFVLEDACHAFGGRDPDSFHGTKYDMGVFSFGIGKNLMATAGGALLSRVLKEELLKEAGLLGVERTWDVKRRFFGMVLKYFLKIDLDLSRLVKGSYGRNRMHPLDAFLLRGQLKKVEQILTLRRQNSRKVIEALGRKRLRFSVPRDENHIYTKLSVIFAEEEALGSIRKELYDSGIDLEDMYVPLHLRDLGYCHDPNIHLSHTESLYKRVINFPVRPNLSRRQVDKILKAIEGMGLDD